MATLQEEKEDVRISSSSTNEDVVDDNQSIEEDKKGGDNVEENIQQSHSNVEINKSNSPSLTSNPRDILLSRARELIREAITADEEENLSKALDYYTEGAEILKQVIIHEQDPNKKLSMITTFNEVLDRAERVKAEQSIEIVETPLIEGEEKKSGINDTECEVRASFENVQVFRTLGEGIESDQQLVGAGTLRLLKLRSSLSMLQLIPSNPEDSQFQFPLSMSVPCLCTAPGYYIFPLASPGTNSTVFYGVVFPPGIPQHYLLVFDKLLSEECMLRRLPQFPAPPQTTTTTTTVSTTVSQEIVEKPSGEITTTTTKTLAVSQPQADFTVRVLSSVTSGIETGSVKLAEGIVAGSKALSNGATKGGEYLKSKITPSEQPVHVNAKVAGTIYIAGKLSPICVTVSKVLINTLAKLAEEIGEAVADSLTGTDIEAKVKKVTPSEGPRKEAARELGKATLRAALNVWEALEEAGKTIYKNTSAATVSVVEHKYGKEVGQATSDSLVLAGNVVNTLYNVDQMGAKAIARRVAKHSVQKSAVNIWGNGRIEGSNNNSNMRAIENSPDIVELQRMLLIE
eukprot:TRINITY_DN2997_c0_g1_i3.p1 TRINITY_DN2997_c0_g1~~TRINITY_DN2997_c0_g1_i3.p1  ORF type:complete len:572 (-),score=142.15 TRINITY_DN2997_c0_g1_i3:149-1864(-)